MGVDREKSACHTEPDVIRLDSECLFFANTGQLEYNAESGYPFAV